MSTSRMTLLVLAIPAVLCAQGTRAGMFPWWESPVVTTLNLTDTQLSQIHAVTHEYRRQLFELRAAVDKAESDFEQVFNDDSIDQVKGNEAIDRLVKARSEMTKTVSEMSLRLRAVLTPQQWQALQHSQKSGSEPGSGRGKGPGRGRHGGQQNPHPKSPDLN